TMQKAPEIRIVEPRKLQPRRSHTKVLRYSIRWKDVIHSFALSRRGELSFNTLVERTWITPPAAISLESAPKERRHASTPRAVGIVSASIVQIRSYLAKRIPKFRAAAFPM